MCHVLGLHSEHPGNVASDFDVVSVGRNGLDKGAGLGLTSSNGFSGLWARRRTLVIWSLDPG